MQHFDNNEIALTLAQQTVHSRLHNMQQLLQRYHKREVVLAALKRISQLKQKALTTDSISRLLGIEGNATREHFGALAALLPDWCEFTGRNRRPPKDPFNVLLSFGYTWLYAHSDAILTSLGFLTWKGYYHQTSSGHAALASDVIESYRHLIERTALTAVNTNRIKLDDFRHEDNQLRLGSTARRNYILMLEKRFLKLTQDKTVWQHLHQQGKSLMANMNNHSPYHPYLES
jgi:CRISPR-associated endonuclease Cas1